MSEIQDHKILRYSLVVVWLTTATVSVFELGGQSQKLLVEAGISDPSATVVVVWGGATIDFVLGLLLWFKPTRLIYLAALGMMLVFTAVATVVSPSLWLHPLGPLLKNIPIAAVLWVLAGANK